MNKKQEYCVYSQEELNNLKIERKSPIEPIAIRIFFGTEENFAKIDLLDWRDQWIEVFLELDVVASVFGTHKHIIICKDNVKLFCNNTNVYIDGQNVEVSSYGYNLIKFSASATFEIKAYESSIIGENVYLNGVWADIIHDSPDDEEIGQQDKRVIILHTNSTSSYNNSCTIFAKDWANVFNPISSKIFLENGSILTFESEARKDIKNNIIEAKDFSIINILSKEFLSGNTIKCLGASLYRSPSPIKGQESHWAKLDKDIVEFLDENNISHNKEKAVLYKAVKITPDGRYLSPMWDKEFVYTIGEIVKPKLEFDDDKSNECGSGIHCGSLDWVRNYKLLSELEWPDKKYTILELEVDINDILIPYLSDGKVRVPKAKVIREI